MADLQGFDGGRSPNEREHRRPQGREAQGNLQQVSNPVFAKAKTPQQKEKLLTGKSKFAKVRSCFLQGLRTGQKNGRPTRIRTSTK